MERQGTHRPCCHMFFKTIKDVVSHVDSCCTHLFWYIIDHFPYSKEKSSSHESYYLFTFLTPLPLFKDLFLNKPFNLRVLWVNFHFQNDLITSGFLPCWFIMANACINGSPICGNQRLRLRSITAEYTTSSWADSICVLEDFQEITLDSQ